MEGGGIMFDQLLKSKVKVEVSPRIPTDRKKSNQIYMVLDETTPRNYAFPEVTLVHKYTIK